MPPAEFLVAATNRFKRDYGALLKAHADLPEHYAEAISILKQELQGIAPGDGQYRFRSGRFRFRYDIVGNALFLKYCALRRENTY